MNAVGTKGKSSAPKAIKSLNDIFSRRPDAMLAIIFASLFSVAICIPFIPLLAAAGRYIAYAGCLAVMVLDALCYFILQHRKPASELEEIEPKKVAELHTYGHDLPKPQPLRPQPLWPQPLRLLLAEDEETNRWLRNVVEEIGRYVVVVGEVSDGKKVLQEAVSLKPDLVLLDVQMPSLNGLKVVREIVKNLSNTKVVILSSAYSPEIEREAIEAGALRYLQKENADTSEIRKTIRLLLYELLRRFLPGRQGELATTSEHSSDASGAKIHSSCEKKV